MSTGTARAEPEVGIYFERKDYAGFLVRLAVDLIDVTAFCVVLSLAFAAIATFLPEDGRADAAAMGVLAVVRAFVGGEGRAPSANEVADGAELTRPRKILSARLGPESRNAHSGHSPGKGADR